MAVRVLRGDGTQATPGLRLPAGTIAVRVTGAFGAIPSAAVTIYVLEGGGGFPVAAVVGDALASRVTLATNASGEVELPELVVGRRPGANRLVIQSDHAHAHVTVLGTWSAAQITLVSPPVTGLCRAPATCQLRVADRGFPGAELRGSALTLEWLEGGGFLELASGVARAAVSEAATGDHVVSVRLSARDETSILRAGILDAPLGPELRLAVVAHRPRLLSCGTATRRETTQVTGTGWLTNRVRLSSVDITQDTTCGTTAARVDHTEIATRVLAGDVEVHPATPGCWSSHATLGIRAITDAPYELEAWFPDYPDDPPRTITGQAVARWQGPGVVTTTPGALGQSYVEHQLGGVRDDAHGVELVATTGDVQFIGPNASSPKPWRFSVKVSTLGDPNRLLRQVTLKVKVRITPTNSSNDTPFPPPTTPGTVSTAPGPGVDELRITIPGNPGVYPVAVYFNANQYNYDHALEVTAVAKVAVRTPPGMTFAVQDEDTTILARALCYRPRLAWSRKTAAGHEPIDGTAIRPSALIKPNGNVGAHDPAAEIYAELRCHDVGAAIDAIIAGTPVTLRKVATTAPHTLYRSDPIVCFLEDAQAWGLPAGFALPPGPTRYVPIGPPHLVQARIEAQMPANPLPRSYATPERPIAFLGVAGLVVARPRPQMPRPIVELTGLATATEDHPIVVTAGVAQLRLRGLVRDPIADLTPGGGLPPTIEIQGAPVPLVAAAEPPTVLRPEAKRGDFDALVALRPGAQVVRIRVETALGGVTERSLLVELIDPRNAYDQPSAAAMSARVTADVDDAGTDPRAVAVIHYWAPHGALPPQATVTATSEDASATPLDEAPVVLPRAPGTDNVYARAILLVPDAVDPAAVAALRAQGTPVLRHRAGTRLRVHAVALPHPAGTTSAQVAIASDELVITVLARRGGGGAAFVPVTHVEVGEELSLQARFDAVGPVSSLDLVVAAADRLGQPLTAGADRIQRVVLTPDPTTGVLALSGAYDAANQLVPVTALRAISRTAPSPPGEVAVRVDGGGTLCAGFSLRAIAARCPVVDEPARLEVGGRPVPPVLPRGHSLRVGVLGTVIAATGELVLDATDATLRGRGLGVSFVRHYASFTRYDGPLGQRWSHGYDVWLRRLTDDHYRLHTGAAQTYDFTRNAAGGFDAPAGIYARLEVERRGDARLAWPGGLIQVFAAARRADEPSLPLVEVRDASKNRVVIRRDQAGALAQVVDPLLDRLYLRHDELGRIVAVGDSTERLWEYAYRDGDLQAVTAPRILIGATPFLRGRRIEYGYRGHRVATVQDALGTASATPLPPALTVKYDGAGRVERQIQEGGWFGFAYSTGQIAVTDPNGNVTKIVPWGLTTLPMEVLQVTANATLRSRYDFNGHGEPTRLERPAGGAFHYGYDDANPDPRARGNLIRVEQHPTPGMLRTVVDAVGLADFTVDPPATDPTVLVWTHTYEPVFQQLATSTDPLGHVTTRRYDYQMPHLARGRADGNLIELEEPTARVGVHPGATGRAIHRTLWNNFGQPTHHIDPDGVVTAFEYYRASKPNGPIGAALIARPDVPTGGLGRLRRDVVPAGLAALPFLPRRPPWIGPVRTRTQTFDYDRWGNLAHRWSNGRLRSTHEHNEAGDLVRTIAAAGTDETLSYDANGRLVTRIARVVDGDFPRGAATAPPRSVTHRYEYDRRGNPTTTVLDDGGLAVTVIREFDANGNLRFEFSPLDAGLPRAQRRRFVEYAYDERNLLIERTIAPLDAPAWTVGYGYDDDGERISVTQPDGLAVWTTRDAWGRRDRTVDADGNGIVVLRDALGRVCGERREGWVDAGPGARRELAEAFVYRDEAGRPVAFVEKAFRWTAPPGPVKVVVGAGRRVTALERDDADHVVAMTGAGGRRVEIRVDGHGGRIAVDDPAVGATVYGYDGDGNQITISLPGPRPGVTLVTKQTYDAAGRMTSQRGPDGGVTRLGYDNRGHLRVIEDPVGNRTYRHYDAVGRLVRETRELREHGRLRDPGAGVDNALVAELVTQHDWDANSNLLAIRDGAGGLIVGHTYGVRGERLTTTLPPDAFPGLGRDDHPGDNVWRFEHDASGRQHAVTAPGGIRIEHGYLPNGNLVRRTITAPAGVPGARAQTFAYDGARRLIAATDDNGGAGDTVTTALAWDSFGNLWEDEVTTAAGGAISGRATFDDRGRLATHTYNTTPPHLTDTASYRFDDAGRMESVEVFRRLAAYSYHGAFLETRVHGNGVVLDVGHDAAGRLESFGYARPTAGTALPRWKLGFDERGLPDAVDQLDRQTQDRHQFDSLARMVDTRSGFDPSSSASLPTSHTTYEWDARGNRTRSTTSAVSGQSPSTGGYTYSHVPERIDAVVNPAGQIGRWSRVAEAPPGIVSTPPPVVTQVDVGYDARGNLVRDGEQVYAHDALNRLVHVTTASGAPVASFVYDALGRRVLKRAGAETRFVHHGGRLLEETEVQGLWSKRYYHHAEGLLAYDVTSAGATYRNYVHADRSGSVTFDTEDTGAPLLRYSYDPATGRPAATDWGGAPVALDRVWGNHVLHQGRYYDIETGLYLTGSRYMHPRLGTFLERDPLGADGTLTPYGFAGGNPLAFADPSGAAWIWIPIALIVGLFAATEATSALAGPRAGQFVGNLSPVHSAAELITGYEKAGLFTDWRGHELSGAATLLNVLDVATAGMSVAYTGLVKASRMALFAARAASLDALALKAGIAEAHLAAMATTTGAWMCFEEGAHGWGAFNLAMLVVRARSGGGGARTGRMAAHGGDPFGVAIGAPLHRICDDLVERHLMTSPVRFRRGTPAQQRRAADNPVNGLISEGAILTAVRELHPDAVHQRKLTAFDGDVIRYADTFVESLKLQIEVKRNLSSYASGVQDAARGIRQFDKDLMLASEKGITTVVIRHLTETNRFIVEGAHHTSPAIDMVAFADILRAIVRLGGS